MLTAPHDVDVEIQGEKFTFGVLADAQAASDLHALKSAGRRAVSLVLARNQADDIEALSELLRTQQT